MKVFFILGKKQEKVYININQGIVIQENGMMIRKKVMVKCIGQIKVKLIKDIGKIIYHKVQENNNGKRKLVI